MAFRPLTFRNGNRGVLVGIAYVEETDDMEKLRGNAGLAISLVVILAVAVWYPCAVADEVKSACERGEKALKDRTWDLAISSFTEAISRNPASAGILRPRESALRERTIRRSH